MKLKFKDQAFQNDAVAAAVQLFAGQEAEHDTFSVAQTISKLDLYLDDGARNILRLPYDALL